MYICNGKSQSTDSGICVHAATTGLCQTTVFSMWSDGVIWVFADKRDHYTQTIWMLM